MSENSHKAKAIAKLTEVCVPGTRLLIVRRGESYRYFDVYRPYLNDRGQINHQWLTRWISDGLDIRYSESRECLSIAGAGTDARVLVTRAIESALSLPSNSLESEWL